MNVIQNHVNGLSVMNFTGTSDNYYSWQDMTNIRTVFWVFHRASGSPTKMTILNSSSNHFLRGLVMNFGNPIMQIYTSEKVTHL